MVQKRTTSGNRKDTPKFLKNVICHKKDRLWSDTMKLLLSGQISSFYIVCDDKDCDIKIESNMNF